MTIQSPAQSSAPRRTLPEWRLTVVDTAMVTPRMLRIGLTAPDLGRLDYGPGQALRIRVPESGGTTERDYTIRRLDRAALRLDLDVLLHGDTPGPNWARSLSPGDRVHARGPRSPVRLWPGRDWYLMAGDETAIPAILHMLESLPPGTPAHAFVEIGEAGDRMEDDFSSPIHLHWIPRVSDADPHAAFVDQVLAFALPAGQGQACIIGQTGPVQRIRRGLIARGMAKADIAAEGYWRPGRTGGTVESLD